VKTGLEKLSISSFEREVIYDKTLSDEMIKTYIKYMKEVCPPSQYTDYLKVMSKLWSNIAGNLEKERYNKFISILTMNVNRGFVLKVTLAVVFSLLAALKSWLKTDEMQINS
jgi:hypothetical protein